MRHIRTSSIAALAMSAFAAAETHTIVVDDTGFTPDSIVVAPGDSILFEVGGPGTDPADGIGHRTHMEIIENAAGLENATSTLDSVWLPGFTGSSFLDVVERIRVRVLGIYDPNGDISVRMSLTLLGGMVVKEAQSWSVPKLVLKRKAKELPRAVTNPEIPAMDDEDPDVPPLVDDSDEIPVMKTDLGLQALLTPMGVQGGEASPLPPGEPGTNQGDLEPPADAMPAAPEDRTESLADALDSILDPVGKQGDGDSEG